MNIINKELGFFLYFWLFMPTTLCYAKHTTIPLPNEAQSLETLTRSIGAILADDQRVICIPRGKEMATVTKFNSKGKTREEVFGAMADYERPLMAREHEINRLTGITIHNDRLLVLDGESFALSEFDPLKFKFLMQRSIPWDLLKPPRDRGGEPTAVETSVMRANFRKAWNKTTGIKVSGIVPMPLAWSKGQNNIYFVALRIPGFPIALMECGQNDYSQCQLTRQCFVEGVRDLKPEAITGIAISKTRNMIILGDRDRHQLIGLSYDSCFNIVKRQTWELPKKIYQINNIAIDEQDRLWIATDRPDDYLNASVYFWPPDLW